MSMEMCELQRCLDIDMEQNKQLTKEYQQYSSNEIKLKTGDTKLYFIET